jgi:hypothetical protein
MLLQSSLSLKKSWKLSPVFAKDPSLPTRPHPIPKFGASHGGELMAGGDGHHRADCGHWLLWQSGVLALPRACRAADQAGRIHQDLAAVVVHAEAGQALLVQGFGHHACLRDLWPYSHRLQPHSQGTEDMLNWSYAFELSTPQETMYFITDSEK